MKIKNLQIESTADRETEKRDLTAGDNAPILFPQVRKPSEFFVLFELCTDNHAFVAKLPIHHSTFHLLCDAVTGILQTVFLFLQVPQSWFHQHLVLNGDWKTEWLKRGMILCCFFFHQPTVLNYGIHSWFLSSTNFWQSQNQPFHGCSVISALA